MSVGFRLENVTFSQGLHLYSHISEPLGGNASNPAVSEVFDKIPVSFASISTKRFRKMGSEEKKSQLKERVFQIFKEFMTRLVKLEEVVAAGSKLLTGYQQGLEFLRRPPIDKSSELIVNIVKVNETQRVKSYFEAGCINIHDNLHNMNKSKGILNELECLLEDVAGAIQTANECLAPLWDKDLGSGLDLQATAAEDVSASSYLQEPEMTDFAALMGIIYSMVKQDYVMQERIVSSLNLKSSSGELESYCLMWSLRPFVNDEVMRQAWRLIP